MDEDRVKRNEEMSKDFTILDKNGNVKIVVRGGKIVYRADEEKEKNNNEEENKNEEENGKRS